MPRTGLITETHSLRNVPARTRSNAISLKIKRNGNGEGPSDHGRHERLVALGWFGDLEADAQVLSLWLQTPFAVFGSYDKISTQRDIGKLDDIEKEIIDNIKYHGKIAYGSGIDGMQEDAAAGKLSAPAGSGVVRRVIGYVAGMIASIARNVWKKLTDPMNLSKLATNLVVRIVKYICQSAYDTITKGRRVLGGLKKACEGISGRLALWQRSKAFAIRPGAPQVVIGSLKSAFGWHIGQGLYTAARQGAGIGLIFSSWGLGKIADALASLGELVFKICWRAKQRYYFNKFTEKCKSYYGQAKSSPYARILRPDVFADFLSKYTNKCPAIAALLMRSGIFSKTVWLSCYYKFNSDGTPTSQSVRNFDDGVRYIDSIKDKCIRLLKDLGIIVVAKTPDAKPYLIHATTDLSGEIAVKKNIGGQIVTVRKPTQSRKELVFVKNIAFT